MSTQHGIAALIWLLGAAAAFGVSTLWLADAQTGKVSAWALVSLAWCAALLALFAHQISELITQRTDVLKRFGFNRQPLANLHSAAQLSEWQCRCPDQRRDSVDVIGPIPRRS